MNATMTTGNKALGTWRSEMEESTIHIDVVLLPGETAEMVAEHLRARFDVKATVDAEQPCPGGASITVTGGPTRLAFVAVWHERDATPAVRP